MPPEPSRISSSRESISQQFDHGIELSPVSIADNDKLHTQVSSEEVVEPTAKVPLLPQPQKENSLTRRFPGWRFGALCTAILSILSLGLNISAAIWLAHRSTLYEPGDLTRLYRGDCSTVERINTCVHLLINVLSTFLLAGSNYAMQCLAAPTRGMVDEAHAQGKWLDIGIPSVRNLRSVSITSAFLWHLLLLSSVPLHLVYNSAVYTTIGANTYEYRVTTQGYFDKLDFNNLSLADGWAQDLKSYEHLDNTDCLHAYAKDFVEDRGHVVVIVKNQTDLGPPDYDVYYARDAFLSSSPYSWLCKDSNSSYKYRLPPRSSWQSPSDVCYLWIDQIEADPQNWALGNDLVDHCLSQHVDQKCGLNASMPILIVVIICNAIKCAIMLYVVLGFKHEPLLVVGDAIASFLLHPDPVTSEAALLSQVEMVNPVTQSHVFNVPARSQFFDNSRIFREHRPRQFATASKRRWSATLTLGVMSITVILAFLLNGLINQLGETHTIASFWRMGFGKANAQSLVSGNSWNNRKYFLSSESSVVTAVLLANLPQLVLSIFYFNFNSLITSICLAEEWVRFSTTRKSLRVSTPKLSQRSTYFLSIPYRYGIPMLIVSTILHWLVSQSVFLVAVVEMTFGREVNLLLATCGYSPLAIIFGSIVGFVVLAAILGVGFPRLKTQIPLVGSCSLAISAKCHPPEGDDRAAFEPIMWGAVPGMIDENGCGYCTFSSRPVQKLEVGKRYK